MKHTNYFNFKAETHVDLGRQMGECFRKEAQRSIENFKTDPSWKQKVEISKAFLGKTEESFPHFVDEINGYAEGAQVSFEELWTKSLEDELDHYRPEKCTTIVTNNGLFISHNEDWDVNSQDAICVVKKTVKDLTMFELFYYNTLGGNSMSVNSHGIVQSINSLTHTDWQMGVPRNVSAAWMSETKSPKEHFAKLSSIKRSLGYNHVLVDATGQITNIECTSLQQEMTQPRSPFIHTNHYLGQLSSFEGTERNGKESTFNRFERAIQLVKPHMTMDEVISLNSNKIDGNRMSIFNERTIARMIVDIKEHKAHVWLKREEETGWVEYGLDFIR